LKPVTDAQVRRLMEEMSKSGKVGQAAMKAGMDRKTGRRYIAAGKLPSEMRQPRWWRTRHDVFAEDWPAVAKLLEETPGLEAQTVLELLEAKQPGRYNESHLRTLQRRIRRWRAEYGPAREIWFTQAHRPGEAAQTDFTSTAELGVTLAGQLFMHLLCVTVLPYSNWQWATACLSESMAALRHGIQSALFELGRVPRYHQTDHSTAATHQIAHDAKDRTFNDEYKAIMRHLGMEPRTTAVGAKEQNGDVEASNGALKRRLEQALLVRGSRDFADQDDYERFVAKVVRKANASRGPRVAEEIEAMRPLVVDRLRKSRRGIWAVVLMVWWRWESHWTTRRSAGDVLQPRPELFRIEIDRGASETDEIQRPPGHSLSSRPLIPWGTRTRHSCPSPTYALR